MPEGFHNPFRLRAGRRAAIAADGLSEPDITVSMATDFVRACDHHQLRLMASIIFGGLRAAEPCCLFHEHLGDGWLRIGCLPDLAYATKGRRDKRVPLLDCLSKLLWAGGRRNRAGCCLFAGQFMKVVSVASLRDGLSKSSGWSSNAVAVRPRRLMPASGNSCGTNSCVTPAA